MPSFLYDLLNLVYQSPAQWRVKQRRAQKKRASKVALPRTLIKRRAPVVERPSMIVATSATGVAARSIQRLCQPNRQIVAAASRGHVTADTVPRAVHVGITDERAGA